VLLHRSHRSSRTLVLVCAVGALLASSAAGAPAPGAAASTGAPDRGVVRAAAQTSSAVVPAPGAAALLSASTTAPATATAATAVAPVPSGTTLSWAPPQLDDPLTVTVTATKTSLSLDPARDYLVRLPSTPLTTSNGVSISGGHDVVLIGGEIRTSARGLLLKNQTGTVHVEGVRVSGESATEGIDLDQRRGATVQLQNIAVETVHGSYSGTHADVLQTWGGPEVLRVDRLEGSTTYQGFFLDPHKFYAEDSPALFDIRNTVLRDSGGTSAYLLWQSGTFPIRTQDVTVVRNPSKPFPKQVLRTSGGQTSWSGVTQGSTATPSPLLGEPGVGYTSPGYTSPDYTSPDRDEPSADPSSAETTLTGTLVRAQGVTAGAAGGNELVWLHSGGTSVPVQPDAVSDVPEDRAVRLRLAPEVGGAAREVLGVEVLAASTAPSPGAARSVTVVQVAPAGTEPDATPLSAVVDAVDDVAAPYWQEQSRGGAVFTAVGVAGWVTSALECRSGAALWDDVADQIGWQGGPGQHLLLSLPSSAAGLPGCYDGLGTVGAGSTYGGRAYVLGASASVITHELGHNLGLGRSDALRCDSTTEGALSATGTTTGLGSCVVKGHGDLYDAMGAPWGPLGSLGALQAARLGSAGAGDRVDVTAPTTVALAAVSSSSGVRALRLVDGASTYWVEFRPALGRDGFLASSPEGLRPGLLLRREGAGGRQSLLLDLTPSSPSRWSVDLDSALPVGSTATPGSGRFTVLLSAASATEAVVSVAVDGRWPADVDTGGVSVTVPAEGAVVGPGPVLVSGSGTAPEGTLRYQVTSAAGTVVADGTTSAGANGLVARWSASLSLPRGAYTLSVWVPDDSTGEGGGPERRDDVRRSFSVT